jgi:hypothetical protein
MTTAGQANLAQNLIALFIAGLIGTGDGSVTPIHRNPGFTSRAGRTSRACKGGVYERDRIKRSKDWLV